MGWVCWWVLLLLAACQALALGPVEECLVYFVSKAVFVYLLLCGSIYVDVNDKSVCWQTPPQPNTSTFLRVAGSCLCQWVPLLLRARNCGGFNCACSWRGAQLSFALDVGMSLIFGALLDAGVADALQRFFLSFFF